MLISTCQGMLLGTVKYLFAKDLFISNRIDSRVSTTNEAVSIQST